MKMLFEEMPEKKEIKLSTVIIVAIAIFAVVTIIMAIIIFGGSKKEPDQPIGNDDRPTTKNVENAITTPVEISSDTSEFSIDFLKLENQKQNMTYSPLSIKYALNMLNEGASGNTKKQIDKVIGDLKPIKYTNQENVLSLANTMYIKNEYKSYIKESYQNSLLQNYNAEINYDAFENAQNVNQWIENKTMGIIKDLLQDNQVRTNRILLINALAIDMEWQSSFEEANTRGEEFNLIDGNKMTATMMNQETNTAKYYKDDNITAISKDLKKYDNTQLEFVAIMPNQNLSEYIQNLKMSDINLTMRKLKPASQAKGGIKIKIPKFSFDYSLKLKQDLMSLGITDAFNSSLANFSNMAERSDFFVNEALHKANIDFTEKGVKAAAVTVFGIKDSATIREEEPEEMKFDKPFLYVIKDKTTGEIWFIGTVYEPNSWEKDQADYQVR